MRYASTFQGTGTRDLINKLLVNMSDKGPGVVIYFWFLISEHSHAFDLALRGETSFHGLLVWFK